MKEKTLREHLLEISKIKSVKKALASRENGKKGGRPITIKKERPQTKLKSIEK